jgi:Uncharacterized protein conserved in bacteria (DUF2059)
MRAKQGNIMMPLDKITVTVLVCLFSFIWTGCMALEQTSNDSAMKLVKAMRIEEIFIFASKRPLLVGPQAATKEDVDAQRYMGCLDGVDRSSMRAGLAERMTAKFTSSELLEALEFYESEAGKKFVIRTLALLPEHIGISQISNPPVEELDDIVRSRVESFVHSPVGKKIITEGFFNSLENSLPALQILQKRVEWCQSQP